MTAFSYAITVASGSSDVVSVPFPYLDKTHVHVTLDAVAVDDADLVWNNTAQIKLPSTPANGVAIKVYRSTPASELQVTWTSPNILDHRDMNNAATQLLYICQENKDVGDSLLAMIEELAGP